MSGVRAKARFESIRYAQVWEDADVLVAALRGEPGRRFLSICSAGDNALALLTLDPAAVEAVDFSPAQLSCLRLRLNAYTRLDHEALLELMGSRQSRRRVHLLAEVTAGLPEAERRWWQDTQTEGIAKHGLGGIGKFERYFRIFRTRVLPLAHSRRDVEAIFEPRTRDQREEFLDKVWNSWRWRLLLAVFFSRTAMGWLGRDPAFFDHVEGSVPAHVARRIREAFVTQEPARNPYLHWLLLGTHGEALPLALRIEHFLAIRSRIDRVFLRAGSITEPRGEARYDGFNLSDVFEYMSPAEFEAAYGAILDLSRSRARIVYWNMMAPRSRPAAYDRRAEHLERESAALHNADKAFFYSAFRLDRALP
jgi:S-adenosylmethionine-diacylglycerol 3-amino-3-carboxypropyl transferase